jgi:glycine cleavage system regulatory protein
MSVLTNKRVQNVNEMQQVLTDSGCIIKTRLGIHDASEDSCSNEGLIILNLIGSQDEIAHLEEMLNQIPGIKAKNIRLCSDED